MDFRNPPDPYDPEAHKKKHEEMERQHLAGTYSLLQNVVNLLIVVGIFAIIFLLIRLL
ncbi:hypothetical protein OIN60_14145 [Paenibacillus sp. P96]|uniref:YqzM family protein n=1 Tax=Paenibacillus zeirhizosphaerae TaxID=2987519 RepID=A0ABT9FT62_9BACL|nr:hypothetical protein [Paenibacillus sp. P96]MDP4097913.1 hypothetical protein [Paenibacillus sp. P96]